uniref:Uncharacterized protein n=1 Tax=Physcomitrium patens TaxID=3218 RepID=A0A2K1J8F8_PHYPA|nr:hypothetical protein PHYPA_020920 [Physcomitrium patens]
MIDSRNSGFGVALKTGRMTTNNRFLFGRNPEMHNVLFTSRSGFLKHKGVIRFQYEHRPIMRPLGTHLAGAMALLVFSTSAFDAKRSRHRAASVNPH